MTTRRSSGHPEIDSWKGVIVGSDECGYGAWAGPLVVCAAAAPIGWDDRRIRDSKLYDRERGEREREQLYEEFYPDRERFPTALVVIGHDIIDRIGVYDALLLAHAEALASVVSRLRTQPLGVVDGNLPVHKFDVPCKLIALPKADQLVPECSLASVIGKVTRDRAMVILDSLCPGYGFADHKGYGGDSTHAHSIALAKLGPCPYHRVSFAPIAKAMADREQGAQPKNAWGFLDDD